MYNNFVLSWIGIGFLAFVGSLLVTAPYGRHFRKGWGPGIDNRLGWIVYESPSLIIIPLFFFFQDFELTSAIGIMFLAFFLHYFHRTLIFPFRIKTKGKLVPLGIVVSAFVFNVINASIIGIFLTTIQNFPDQYVFDPRFLLGLLLFILGAVINISSDNHLISLRSKNQTGYSIPRKGLFRWISCPNHFGEIIEWTGFAIMLWSLSGASFAIWTAANLIPRSLDHHKWYQKNFTDYPVNRKAIIPGLL